MEHLMFGIVEGVLKRYLKRHHPEQKDEIVRKAHELFPRLMKDTPDLGGKENSLAYNMELFILFIAYYEASDHLIDGEAFDEIFDDLYRTLKPFGFFLNCNNKVILKALRAYLYRNYQKYADTVKQKQAEGKWMDTWGMVVNPENTDVGLAFTLVGCPLAEYAKRNGYSHLMPHLCCLDHVYARVMHTKLIRNHTVAQGADSCDYWYVPDRQEEEEG